MPILDENIFQNSIITVLFRKLNTDSWGFSQNKSLFHKIFLTFKYPDQKYKFGASLIKIGSMVWTNV